MKKLILLFAFIAIGSCNISFAQRECSIIPKPQKISYQKGSFLLTSSTKIVVGMGTAKVAAQLQKMLEPATGFRFATITTASKEDIVISLRIDQHKANLGAEAYTLTVEPKHISITASSTNGLYYGCQSLLQLLPASIYKTDMVQVEKWVIPCVQIEDWPRFAWRGMMLDASRQFVEITYLKKYLDWLAVHKINVFHWHLTDDQGWRIEIKKYPELTGKGADLDAAGAKLKNPRSSICRVSRGYYTQDQIKDVVKYALERNIQILPEIDFPGHSFAVLSAYPELGCALDTVMNYKNVWCASNPQTNKMIEDIFAEVAQLFPFEYIHIGGDEVGTEAWSHCKLCKQFIIDHQLKDVSQIQGFLTKNLESYFKKLHKKIIGWNELLEVGDLEKGTTVMSWTGTEPGQTAARNGNKAVMSPGSYMYFDMPQAPGEYAHWWAGLVDYQKTYSYNPMGMWTKDSICANNIIGVEGCLWGEFLDRLNWTDYQTFPRLCALAEVGWSNQETRNIGDFQKRLTQAHYQRLVNMGIHFRLDKPVHQIEDGMIRIVPPYEGAVVRYTTDGTLPVSTSPVWEKPFSMDSVQKLCSSTFIGNLVQSPVTVGISPCKVFEFRLSMLKDTVINLDLKKFIYAGGKWNLAIQKVAGDKKLRIHSVDFLRNGISFKRISKRKDIGDYFDGKTFPFTIDTGLSTDTISCMITFEHDPASNALFAITVGKE